MRTTLVIDRRTGENDIPAPVRRETPRIVTVDGAHITMSGPRRADGTEVRSGSDAGRRRH